MMLGLAPGTVRLAPPTAEWAEAFTEEAARLAAAVGALPFRPEHVGSTAVPGLVAKPILDLLGGVPAHADRRPYIAALTGAGYEWRGEYGIPGRDYFVRDAVPGLRTHHLHVVAVGGELWRAHLAFRDALRRDPSRAAAYAALKAALATRFPNARDAYTAGKDAFVRETLGA